MEEEGYASDAVNEEDSLSEDDGGNDRGRRSQSTSDSSLPGSAATSSGDDDRARRATQVTFDSALPIKHSYLGDNLEEVRGRTLLEEGSTHTLPIFIHNSLVLVPGQTLPLMVQHPSTIDMLRTSVAQDRTFGVVCIRSRVYNDRDFNNHRLQVMAGVGTTAEIYAWQENKDDPHAPEFKIKARGRQRFKILEVLPNTSQLLARVRILREAILPPLLASHGGPQRRRAEAAGTAWPVWVHALYDAGQLARELRARLADLITSDEGVHIPTDPVQLSYWSTQNLPLEDDQRIALLRMDSAVQRLRFQLDFIQRCETLVCSRCRQPIADPKDVFSMSQEGPQGTYVNPGGFVHETMTLMRARNLLLRSERPSYEYSWFPGYGWRMVECTCCGKHMGWLFSTGKSSLHPKSFYGLCRASLTVKIVQRGDQEQDQEA